MLIDLPTCFIAMPCCCVVACAQRVTWLFVLVVVSAFACVFASPLPSLPSFLPSSSIIKYVIDFEWPNGEEEEREDGRWEMPSSSLSHSGDGGCGDRKGEATPLDKCQ